jgi:hypothetical protein
MALPSSTFILPFLLLSASVPLSTLAQFAPSAPANPAAVVSFGPARFTVLTDSLVRMELAGRGAAPFDDRPSLAVLTRNMSTVPSFTVTLPDPDTVVVSTSALTLSYTTPGGNSSSPSNTSTCARPMNADVDDGSRVPSFPFGANVTSVGGCCGLCDSDPDCQVFIYDPTEGDSPNCWLMEGVTSLHPASGRISGGILPFSPGTLNVTFTVNGEATTWTPGTQDPLNLLGAFHALDCYDTPANCISDYKSGLLPGFVSRSGWFVLDDTASARLVANNASDPSPLPYWYANATSSSRPAADLYFFGHGLNYRQALADYTLIGGPPSLPPASAYNVWWSHWQTFSEQGFVTQILDDYASYNLPLSHVVLDVDWHTEPTDPRCYNYGGFTVNTTLWPTWTDFVNSLHDGTNPTGRPLKLLLNLHPQGGTDICQANWPAFSALVGALPGTDIVPCTFGNQNIASALFTAFMDTAPLTEVDAWW